ncbi:hypothetical protein BH18THE2_BH18THE2_36220 [soil metagenome]
MHFLNMSIIFRNLSKKLEPIVLLQDLAIYSKKNEKDTVNTKQSFYIMLRKGG